jgi:hypothetical protein
MKLPTLFNRSRTASVTEIPDFADLSETNDGGTGDMGNTGVIDYSMTSTNSPLSSKDQQGVQHSMPQTPPVTQPTNGPMTPVASQHQRGLHSTRSMSSTRSLSSPVAHASAAEHAGEDAAARAAAIDECMDLRARTDAQVATSAQQSVCPDRHSKAFTKTAQHVNQLGILAGIAWFGEMSSRQIGRVWLPGRHPSNVSRQLTKLEEAGFISCRWWYYKRKQQALPVRYGKLWSLTETGIQLVRDLPIFPKRYHGPRTDVLLAHDTLTTQVLVHMIEQARVVGLSGVYIEREVQLNPPERRPIMDAVITLRTGGTPFPTNTVPWFNPPHDPKERNESSRKYAIENDRDSEQIAVIVGKAHSYQQAATYDWVERNGQFPIPVWIVPTPKRRDNVMHAWMKAWPHGKWLITTDADLIRDRWIEYFDGCMRERRLFK